ncbi:L,D-transpeptidase [Actinopolyspora lacussalsi]
MELLSRSSGGSMVSPRQRLRTTLLCLVALLVAGCGTGAGGDSRTQTSGSESSSTGPPAIEFTPKSGASSASPVDDVGARAKNATFTEVVMTNASGEKVESSLEDDGRGWSVQEPLGYGKTYEVVAKATGADGEKLTERSRFTTLTPENLTYVSMNPLDGQTVGVGQPLAFYFSEDAPAPVRERAEKAIDISTDPKVKGEFYWFDDREVHWRPKEYWEPGTEITVDVNIYGKDLGNGVYGESDRHATVKIGDEVIVRADAASHRMKVTVNGELERTIPVSLGRPSYPSHNGTHVVMRKHDTYMMDSTTYGLGLDEGGYRTEVEWAVRISNGGEFLHAAPWSVGDQGERNVSHGCINMSTADAKWVYGLLKKGDVVEVTNSKGGELASWDGFGDWQVPWSEWTSGNS